VFIDIDGDGVMDEKIIGGSSTTNDNNNDDNNNSTDNNKESSETTNDHPSASGKYDVFTKTERLVETSLHPTTKASITKHVHAHGSSLLVDYTANTTTNNR